MRKVILSKSVIIKLYTQYSKEFREAYLFTKTLSSQTKHPIILNYKQQLTQIRQLINYSDYKFRKSLNNAIHQGLITVQGNHLKLWSKNQDRAFKPSKKNDYYYTSNVKEFIKITLFEYHQNKQIRSIKSQTSKSVQNSGFNEPNYNISCSTRAIAKLFQYKSSASGHKLIKYMSQNNHIALKKNRTSITKQQFRDYLKQGNTNIRYDNGYYLIHASTFTMKSIIKRKPYEPINSLPEYIKIAYLDMGYSVEQINNMLG